jgi:transcriptional regulator with XRE-family HTH domain
MFLLTKGLTSITMKLGGVIMHLKQIRRKKSILQKDMAKLIGVSLKQFQRYEQHINMPPFDKVVMWCAILKLTLNQFKKIYLEEE